MSRIKKKESITIAVEALFERTKDLPRGQLIRYEDIIAITGMTREHMSFRTVMAKWRTQLLEELSIATRCENGVGVRLLLSSEQVTVCGTGRHRRIVGQTKRGIREVSRADDDEIDEWTRRSKIMHVESFANTEDQVKRMLRENQHRIDEKVPAKVWHQP